MTARTDDHMTIRQMCDAFEVTPRTLRFYEAKELISPLREGARRLYTRRDRARLKLILRGKRIGLALSEIREILDLYELARDEASQSLKLLQLLSERKKQLEEQRRDIDAVLAEIVTLEGHCRQVIDTVTGKDATS